VRHVLQIFLILAVLSGSLIVAGCNSQSCNEALIIREDLVTVRDAFEKVFTLPSGADSRLELTQVCKSPFIKERVDRASSKVWRHSRDKDTLTAKPEGLKSALQKLDQAIVTARRMIWKEVCFPGHKNRCYVTRSWLGVPVVRCLTDGQIRERDTRRWKERFLATKKLLGWIDQEIEPLGGNLLLGACSGSPESSALAGELVRRDLLHKLWRVKVSFDESLP
jgi:hypothetical protein